MVDERNRCIVTVCTREHPPNHLLCKHHLEVLESIGARQETEEGVTVEDLNLDELEVLSTWKQFHFCLATVKAEGVDMGAATDSMNQLLVAERRLTKLRGTLEAERARRRERLLKEEAGRR